MSTISKQKMRPPFTARATELLHKPWVEIVLLLVLTLVFWMNFSANFNRKVDMNGDNIYYFALGQALADGKGYVNTIGFTETPHTHFPPGYPAYIAVLQHVVPDNQLFVKRMDGVLLYLAVVLLFFLLKRMTGSVIIPFCACLLTSVQVDVLRFGSMMMSEPLFTFCSIALLYLAVLLHEADLFDYRKWWNYVLLFAFLCLVAYIQFVRTIALALILSLLLWLFVETIVAAVSWLKQHDSIARRRCLQFGLLLVLVLLTWGVPKKLWDERNVSVGKTGMAYQAQFMQKSGGGTMATFDDWMSRIGTNVHRHIVGYVPQAVFRTDWSVEKPTMVGDWALGLLLVALMLLGVAYTRKGGLLMFFYVGATMAVLAFYAEAYSTERYFIAIIPLFFFLFLNGVACAVHLLGRTFKLENTALWQSAVVLLITLFVAPVQVEAQTDNRKMAKMKSYQALGRSPFNDYLRTAKWCGDNLPDTARVFCRKPEVFYMHSDYHHAEMIPITGTPDSVITVLERRQAEYIIIDSWFGHAYRTIYPTVLAYPQRFELVHQEGMYDERYHTYPTFVVRFRY